MSDTKHYDEYDELNYKRLRCIYQCMIYHTDANDPDAEWPENIISRFAVIYSSGVISKKGKVIRHEVDRNELKMGRQLSTEIAEIMKRTDVGMGSESFDSFQGFFIPAVVGESSPPTAIDEQLIRSRFAETIFPPATITIEPLREEGIWWTEVCGDGEQYAGAETALVPWRAMNQWFQERPEFIDTICSDRGVPRFGKFTSGGMA